MSFDRDALIAACNAHGTVTRVVVAAVRGSAPREVGAAMLVWRDGFSGTIGGGSLEHKALQTARGLRAAGENRIERHALGPDLGQCCGGSVDLLFETYAAQTAQDIPRDVFARGPGEAPLGVARLLSQRRNAATAFTPQLLGDWMIEPVSAPGQPVWIWGAGHVGRALVGVMAPLPQFHITWVDTNTGRFPDIVQQDVETIAATDPVRMVKYAPIAAWHLIVTYSHDLDLALCDQLLRHGFDFAGLIGSATKWARFRSRLQNFGHAPQAIGNITCPIGNPTLGKHPQAIALGVATDLLARDERCPAQKGCA